MLDNAKQPRATFRQPVSGAHIARHLAAARAGSQAEFATLTEPHRRELLTHCYRMMGSLQDAEDLVQETFLRAWRRLDTYEGRASFRAWLYKIATNACLDALDRRPKRTLPTALHAATDPGDPILSPITEPIWLEPFPDELFDPPDVGPEARYDARESVTLAFLIALQVLPPRQRAVLILCDVLDWHAREVAELLDLTVSAVSSLLHRARTTLAKHYHARSHDAIRTTPPDGVITALLHRYVRAWETANVDELVSLLKEDARFPMPPIPSWYQGRAAIRAFVSATILAGDAVDRWRLQPVRANAQPGFAWYRRNEMGGSYHAYAIQVLTFDGDLLADITTFGNPALFPHFGLPLELKA
jgi:RNA polymerase sigma-70 factor (ECF subfamily)